MLKKDTAICLRATDYSETSQVVTLFANQSGKISAIAKGSKRPKSAFDGPIEIFSFGDIVYSAPRSVKLATLTQFNQKPAFLKLRNNLAALNSAFFAAELLDAFTQDFDPHAELFDAFVQFLTDIQATNSRDAIGLLILFQLTILTEVGTKPVLTECVNCRSPFSRKWREAHFCSSVNGLICPDCDQAFVDKIRLSKNAAATLADIKLIAKADDKTLNEIEKTLIGHFTELMHHPPKMAKSFLKK
jgi:DNA repair protein RecO (recombination protein O)